jgi:NAD(P)-dependent dehydrogenase (short-subunit alcohol dehydrogenase family)
MSAWRGQVAFVTGGASGIGLGMAEAFASAGMLVTIADIEQPALVAAVAQLAAKGLHIETMVLDVRDLGAFQAAAEALASRHGRVDLVCNNAGVVFERDAADWTDAGWRWVLDVNLMGVVHGYQAFLPILKRQGRGHFVNTASVTGLLGRAHIGQYGATKFAIVGLSQTMREELAPDGVGVHVLCPGKVMTNIMHATRNAPPQLRSKGRLATIAAPPLTPKPAGLRDVSDAFEVGRMVLAAVEEDVFYILTDLTWAAEIAAEQAKLRDGLAWLEKREAAPSRG